MGLVTLDPRGKTVLEIWTPKYSSAYGEPKEATVLLARYKVSNASPVLIVNFIKAHHLLGQRFCISRDKALSYPVVSNGKIEVLQIPISAFDAWQTPSEVSEIAKEIFNG